MLAGGIGLISVYFISDPDLLVYSMIGVGIAWASILSMPYAMLAGSIPPLKMGIYMGIFNFFITIPQIVNGLFGGILLTTLYNGHSIYALVTAGMLMIIGAIASMRVEDVDDITV